MTHPLEILSRAHELLSRIDTQQVYTGGATIPLYLDDPGRPDFRPTIDTDVVVEVTTRSEYYDLEAELREVGFKQPPSEDAPICRWFYRDIIVDIMPVDEAVFGFSNPWYKPGFSRSMQKTLPDGKKIDVFSEPYLIASKIVAFEERGEGDFWGSVDFEDIVRILDGCSPLEGAIKKGSAEVKQYLRGWFLRFINRSRALEYIVGQLPRGAGGMQRGEWIIERIHSLFICE